MLLSQAYFEVADQSGVMSMVLWNDLCLEWYHKLLVGSVVYLQSYSLKKSYQNRSRPQISQLSLITFRSTGTADLTAEALYLLSLSLTFFYPLAFCENQPLPDILTPTINANVFLKKVARLPAR